MCIKNHGSLAIMLMVVLLFTSSVLAQQKGHPLLRHFTPQEYGAHFQVNDVDQLPYPDGRMLLATGNGIVVYDGVRFTMAVGTPLMVNKLQNIERFGMTYGSAERFGILTMDAMDRAVYNNITGQLDSTGRSFGFLNEIHDFQGNILITTPDRIIRYNGEFAEYITSPRGSMFLSFILNGRYYVGERGTGLLGLNSQDELELTPGGEFFASNERMPVFMFPMMDGKILIGTNRDGLYLYSPDQMDSGNGRVERFHSQIQELLSGDVALVQGIELRNGKYALATSQPAVHIFDREGKVIQTINSLSGMPNESINRLFEDYQGNLWIALNNGVVLAEINHPVSRYGAEDGIQGTILKSLFHNNELFLATSVGVFQKKGNLFQPISGITGLTWDIESWSHPDRPDSELLLIANQFGLYMYDGTTVRQLNEYYASALRSSRVFPYRIYLGGANFTTMLEWNNGTFVQRGDLISVGNPVRGILEDDDGTVWLATQSNGMRRLSPEYNSESMKIYLNEGDYDVSGNAMMQWIDGRLVVSTMFNFYAYDESTDTFVDHRLEGLTEEDHSGIYFHLYEGDRYWLGSSLMRDHIVEFTGLGEGRTPDRIVSPYRAIPPVVSLHIQLAENKLWVSNPDGLFMVDLGEAKTLYPEFRVHLQELTVFADSVVQINTRSQTDTELVFAPARYRFSAAAPWFDSGNTMEYRFRMEGLGEVWSEWSPNSEIEYTALREGSYTIFVEARNREGEVASAAFEFVINPPWHRSWWMYLMMILIGTGLVVGSMQVMARARVRKLEAFNRELEQQVLVRSEELRQRNEALRQLNAEKNDFMNIAAHDLRNPLTGIQGMASMMVDAQSDMQSNVVRDFGRVIHNSSRQMFDIIDGYLNVHKIEQGEMHPVFTEFDLGQYVTETQSRYAAQLSTKSIQCEVVTRPVMVKADLAFTSQILDNLVSNAIKYSDPGTNIRVEVDEHEGFAYFRISDQGPGIPPDKMGELYKKFSKIGNKPTGGESSVGLGLSIVKQLVEKMHGRIECESEPGVGTTFTVFFQLV